MASPLSLLGFLMTHAVILWYFQVINREKVPVSIGPFSGAILTGMVLSAVGFALDPGGLTGGLMAVTLFMGGFILWLLTQRKVPDGNLIVSTGQPMPLLAATTDTGAAFDLASLKGRRVMVKFFRGSW
ncbi:MAG: hypothetical protein ACI8RZ_000172 [Myxococcota bacterium]|jgi:hypothetical protein